MTTRGPVTLRIELDAGADADDDELDAVARSLRSDLLELDVDAVARPEAPAPDGARAGGVVALGTLLVTLGPTMLGSVCTTIEDWFKRRGSRRIELEIDGDRIVIDGVSGEDQRRLVETFVARHAAP
jgi:hypothetical protein